MHTEQVSNPQSSGRFGDNLLHWHVEAPFDCFGHATCVLLHGSWWFVFFAEKTSARIQEIVGKIIWVVTVRMVTVIHIDRGIVTIYQLPVRLPRQIT